MEEFITPLTVSYTDRHRNPKKHTLYISTTEENAPTGKGFNISPDAQLGTIKYLTLNHCSVDSGAVVLSGKHRDSSFDSGTYIDGNVDTVGVSFQPSHEGRIHIEGDITVVGRNICGDFTLKATTSSETKISFGQPRPLYFVNKGDGDLLYHLPSLLAVEGEDYEVGIVYPYTTDLKKGDAQKKLSAFEKNTENLSQSGVTVQTFCIAPKSTTLMVATVECTIHYCYCDTLLQSHISSRLSMGWRSMSPRRTVTSPGHSSLRCLMMSMNAMTI